MLASPFHAGELRAQALAGGGSGGAGIRPFMPDQHRSFFAQLPMLFAGVTDAEGWPVATVLTGQPGFVGSPDQAHLAIAALPQEGDPAFGHVMPGQPVGLLGFEFPTRRRNRANGMVAEASGQGFTVAIEESFGNCAKYIQTRAVRPADRRFGPARRFAGLNEEARAVIGAADTFFVATRSSSLARLDMSHRGGRPGFVRVVGDELLVPDFRGNRYYNTFGNLLEDERAGLLFIDFAAGTLLHLRGTATIDWRPGPDAPEGAERVLRFSVRDTIRRPGLPLSFDFLEAAPTTLETGMWAN